MNAISEAATAIRVALKTVPKLRVYDRAAPVVDPPGAFVGPASLQWESQGCVEPTGATFPVFLIVAADERAIDRLHDLVLVAAAAIDAVDTAVVTAATPTVYDAGTSGLPAYLLTVEMSL